MIVLGIGGYLLEGRLNPSLVTKIFNDLRAELIGIGLTVVLIDLAYKRVQTREEKERLILQMSSPDNPFAIEALRQITERGWLTDGSLRGA